MERTSFKSVNRMKFKQNKTSNKIKYIFNYILNQKTIYEKKLFLPPLKKYKQKNVHKFNNIFY